MRNICHYWQTILQCKLIVQYQQQTAVTGFANGITTAKAWDLQTKPRVSWGLFICCAVRPHQILSGISIFLLPFQKNKKHISISRILSYLPVSAHNSAHSLTNYIMWAIKGIFPVSSACVDDKPIRIAELQVLLRFPTHHHPNLTIYLCVLILDINHVWDFKSHMSPGWVMYFISALILFFTTTRNLNPMALAFTFLQLAIEVAAVNQNPSGQIIY